MAKTIQNPIFFLPVECTPRELDYKLNLARHVCAEGFDVIIGNPPFIRDELKYKNYKGGFLEKGVNPDPGYYRNLKEKGVLLYCLSDEGAAHPAFSVSYQPAVEALKTMEHIFLWGDFQKKDLLERNPEEELNAKYNVTGYPGFEFSFSKYRDYHKRLKPFFLPNDYILINTNFGSINGFTLEENFEACPLMSPETRKKIIESYEQENKSFNRFYEWLKGIITSYPEQIFLLRPHPTEKKEVYEQYFSSFPNVIISKQGNINQVISGAKLVLHNDCTSALQSYLMGVPVISLAYEELNNVHAAWSLSFGALPQSLKEIKDLIDDVLKNKSFDPSLQAMIKKNAVATISERFCNIENSTKDIISIIVSEMKHNFKDFIPYKAIDSRNMMQKAKCFIRRYLPLHYKTPIAGRGLLVPFSKNDVKRRLDFLEKIDGLHISYKINKIYPNTFMISKSK
jgi:surface carbohydrate biosynthesis protein